LQIINPITAILLTIGTVGVAKELLAGKELTCACLGMIIKMPMTWITLLENALMAIMAYMMIFM
jgi:hypothetical protein